MHHFASMLGKLIRSTNKIYTLLRMDSCSPSELTPPAECALGGTTHITGFTVRLYYACGVGGTETCGTIFKTLTPLSHPQLPSLNPSTQTLKLKLAFFL